MALSSILSLILVLVVIGFVLWLVFTYIPMPLIWRRVIGVIIVILVLLWLINRVGGAAFRI